VNVVVDVVGTVVVVATIGIAVGAIHVFDVIFVISVYVIGCFI
jgi:hypothetical protein